MENRLFRLIWHQTELCLVLNRIYTIRNFVLKCKLIRLDLTKLEHKSICDAGCLEHLFVSEGIEKKEKCKFMKLLNHTL